MDRQEAVLRELNLYPQWVRRNPPAIVEEAAPAETQAEPVQTVAPVAEAAHMPRQQEVAAEPEHAEVSAQTVHAETVPSEAVAQDREGLIARLGWPELKTLVRDCTACKLRAGCTQTVFGVGDQQADWLFVGEGPGADEDARGEPFVGQAGKLLDSMLLALKLKRGDHVYIANVVKCRPPENRTPEADEIATCLPYLQRQIQLIQPRVIVALGKTAATALLNTGDVTLGSLRGKVHDYQGIPLIITYHPAYLLRSPMEKAKAWQDLCLARKTMRDET
ncbi:MAG TPA: uracil-DNA glycosylase family protein [Gallionella sp.]|nr:uracil-DNA glycosylase family protein [Gallionella sp.]